MPVARVCKMIYRRQAEIVNQLVERVRSLEITPRRVLIVSGGDRYDLTALMRELAKQVSGHYIDHLGDCLPQLSSFPLEAYKPVNLREDLKEMLDKGGKTLIVGELEWVLATWDEGNQCGFFESMATFTHKNVLALACRLPLDYETLIGDRRLVFRL